MAQYITMSVATILVLANFVLVSSALPSYNVKDLGKKSIVLTKDAIVSQHEMAVYLEKDRAARFIGDLIVGEEHPDQTLYVNQFELTNTNNVDVSGTLSFTVKGIVNMVGVFNQQGTNVVVCDTPKTLGAATSIVNVRVAANSKSLMTVIIAAH